MDDLPLRLDYEAGELRAFRAEGGDAGRRLDLFLAPRLPGLSRSALQRMIREGHVLLNDAPARPSAKVREGDRVEAEVPLLLEPSVDPEDLPIRVLLEEESFLVVDKAPGMAVHPGRGRPRGTLANALAFRCASLSAAGGGYRPGIVHRLDLETSGVMVVAKSDRAHAALAAAFERREVRKEYRALVLGDPPFDEDRIDLPLGRDPGDPERMAVRFDRGREASTEVEVVRRYGATAHVRCFPRTGRTHQIRVHLATRGHPILGDRAYAGARSFPFEAPRILLHALRLRFPHPDHPGFVEVEAPLPEDFLDALRAVDSGGAGR